ncbi:hypothetical protein HZC30_06110 [Candidatus Woesearchaeota archaeon]|nr:hypothetical protein [Candidatus Woesearchaeota archaeon]
MHTYLLSIKQEHFEALLDGRKKHEFRRKFANIKEDFMIVFYLSSPVKAICGYGLFGAVIKDRIQKMVELVSTHEYSSPERIINYFQNLEWGYALPVKSIYRIDSPLSLAQLTLSVFGFKAPQSFLSLDNPKYNIIKKMVIKHGS